PLEYDVLTDPGNEYARKLGIRYQLPEYLVELYAKFGIDLPAFHEESSWTLPIPARLVVDQQGTVRFAEAAPDYTVRPEPQQTLEVLRGVVG
ncbi:MAG: thioredoxin domain-containing protein, partial [Planctomycetota bacterium]